MNSPNLRRLFVLQAQLLLIGWFAVLACQASIQSAPDDANVFVGLGVVAAFVAFGFAGWIRSRINRSIKEDVAGLASEVSIGNRAA